MEVLYIFQPVFTVTSGRRSVFLFSGYGDETPWIDRHAYDADTAEKIRAYQ